MFKLETASDDELLSKIIEGLNSRKYSSDSISATIMFTRLNNWVNYSYASCREWLYKGVKDPIHPELDISLFLVLRPDVGLSKEHAKDYIDYLKRVFDVNCDILYEDKIHVVIKTDVWHKHRLTRMMHFTLIRFLQIVPDIYKIVQKNPETPREFFKTLAAECDMDQVTNQGILGSTAWNSLKANPQKVVFAYSYLQSASEWYKHLEDLDSRKEFNSFESTIY